MAFHMGQWGMTDERPSIDNSNADILGSKRLCIISRDHFVHVTVVLLQSSHTFA